jgi:hypothetical protein
MPENEVPAVVVEYFHALRTEIIEAQKLRVQVGLAKIVFVGSLLGFFLKDAKGDPAILICPIVAIMFDCMVYGLSFNIRDIGNYIAGPIEDKMRSTPATADFLFWQSFRHTRSRGSYRDWGRAMFRLGSYGLSTLVALVAFLQATSHKVDGPRPVPVWVLAPLIALLGIGWGTLIWLEFFRGRSQRRASTTEGDHGELDR